MYIKFELNPLRLMSIAAHRLSRRIANFDLFIVKQSNRLINTQSQEVGLFFSDFGTYLF